MGRKGVPDLGIKGWSMCRTYLSLILPFTKKLGDVFEHNVCPKGWDFDQMNLQKFKYLGSSLVGGVLKLQIDQHIPIFELINCKKILIVIEYVKEILFASIM